MRTKFRKGKSFREKEKGDYQYLRERGFDATTGEESVKQLGEKDEAVHGYRKTDNVYEMIAAEASELVVIIRQASPGSIAETHEFLQNETVASKTHLYLDQANKNGYIANGFVLMHEKTQKIKYITSNRLKILINVF